jgi:U3 small nucleolar RNA-associated protein 22
MALFLVKRRKIHHNNGETNSATEPLESSDSDIEKPQTVRPKRAQDVDESALYSGGLYNSSMFKLEIDEMLAQVQLNYEKQLPGLDEALLRLKTLIEGIENKELLPVRFRLLLSYAPF